MAIDAGTIAQLMSAMSPQARMQQYVQSLAKGGYGGQDAQGGATGVGPGVKFGANDPGFTYIPANPPSQPIDPVFNATPNAGPGEAYTPPTFWPKGWGTVGGGGGGGAGGGNNALQGLAQAIIRRIGNSSMTAGPTSRVDPFNPYGGGSQQREDSSMPSQAGPDIPSAMDMEHAIMNQGRQTSRSAVPPQAMQDYVRQAVLAQLGKVQGAFGGR